MLNWLPEHSCDMLMGLFLWDGSLQSIIDLRLIYALNFLFYGIVGPLCSDNRVKYNSKMCCLVIDVYESFEILSIVI